MFAKVIKASPEYDYPYQEQQQSSGKLLPEKAVKPGQLPREAISGLKNFAKSLQPAD